MGDEFKAYCLETGVIQEFAATNTPQHIGVSECVGGRLCGMVNCMLVDSGYPPLLWREFMLTASYLCNRMPHSAFKMETLYKMFKAKTPTFRTSESSALGRSSISRTPGRSHVVGRNGVRIQPEREQPIPHLEPQDASSCRMHER